MIPKKGNFFGPEVVSWMIFLVQRWFLRWFFWFRGGVLDGFFDPEVVS